MKKWITTINFAFLFFTFPVLTQAISNSQLKTAVGTQVKEVLEPWIGIACGTMLISIIAGAGIIIMSGDNPQMRNSGKSLVIGSGIVIALLLSSFAITALFLGIFGISMI